MKKIKPFLKIAGWLVVIMVLYLAGIIIYGSITDYKPAPGSHEQVELKGSALASAEIDSILNFMIWNIGYGGLGKEMDFFFDGGKSVRAPREIWNKDFKGQLEQLTATDSIDFYLIQEIDINSKRSYGVNQYDSAAASLNGYTASFGLNYNVKFVPKPYMNPFGKVYSGVATFSKYQPAEAERYQYPGKFGWPTRIFFLDRCFLSSRFKLKNGKELVVINTHNSAYDETGEIKKQEMDFLKKFVEDEYKKGNYVIAGGDWNQCPPNFDAKKFIPAQGYNGFIPPSMDFDYTPENWLWAYDPDVPTNRHLDTPLDASTFKTVIDFYLLSPNIQLLKIKTVDMQFEYSDHQPVLMQVRLN